MPRPKFEPTEQDRRNVAAMVAFGIPQDDIAALIINPHTGKPLSRRALGRAFKAEIRTGKTKAHVAVLNNLYRIATDAQGGRETVAAAIFWAKTQLGWKETSGHEVTGKDGEALIPQQELDLSALTVEELRELRELVQKATPKPSGG